MNGVFKPIRIILGLAALVLSFGLSGAEETGTVYVEPDLQGSLSSPSIGLGEEMHVSAWLAEGGKVSKASHLIRHFRMSAYILQPDGSRFSRGLFDNGLNGDAKGEDGVFTCRFSATQAGEHNVRIVAEGKGFRKEREQVFYVVMQGHAEGDGAQGRQIHASVPEVTDREAGRSPHKKSWITFGITHGSLALLWLGAFGYLFLRQRKTGSPGIATKEMDFGRVIRTLAGEKLQQLTSGEKKEQKKTESDAKVISEMHAARLLFLKSLCTGAQKSGQDIVSLWKEIYGSFDETLTAVLKGKKASQDNIEMPQEQVEEIGIQSEKLNEAKKPADLQAENEILREMVRELEASVKTKQQELADAFRKFEALEAEYMVLYQEKQAGQQQPDI